MLLDEWLNDEYHLPCARLTKALLRVFVVLLAE